MRFRNHGDSLPRRIGVAVLGACLSLSAMGTSNPTSQAVILEVIVKFGRESDPGRLVQRVLSEHPGDLRELVAIEERLHAATGVPMQARRITSGAEIVLGIPERPLLEAVQASVDGHPDIAATRLMAVEHDNPNLPESLLVLAFPESGVESALMVKARGDPAYAESVQETAARLCQAGGVPVRGEAGADGEMIVTVDRVALLQKLVAQLNALDIVDYAQANTTLQIMK